MNGNILFDSRYSNDFLNQDSERKTDISSDILESNEIYLQKDAKR